MFRVFLLIFVVYATIVKAFSINDQQDPQPQALTYLGNVGTKQFFVADALESWHAAGTTCWQSGLSLVKIQSEAELAFITQLLMVENRGPFWLGARDLGNRSLFRWSEYTSPPSPDDPNTFIQDYIYYYNYVEQGPLALQMNAAVGPAVFGAHSLLQTAKAFCQSGSIQSCSE